MPDGPDSPVADPPVAHPPAANLPPETIYTEDRTIACDGGPLGHPRVFLRIEGHQVVCPYCSRVYILKEGAGHGGH